MSVTLDQINLGTAPAGKDGDTQRTANSKTNANMAKIADAFTANDAALAGKASADNAALTTGMTVTGAAPVMNLVESDQTAPAGRWRIRAEGGALGVARMTATPSTYTDALSIGANGQVSFASRPSFAAATPWDSANLPVQSLPQAQTRSFSVGTATSAQ